MSIQDLYQRCREGFLVNSDLTLRAQLVEFKDHKLIKSKKVINYVDFHRQNKNYEIGISCFSSNHAALSSIYRVIMALVFTG